MNCCPHCEDAGDFFSQKTARRDLKRYGKKGPLKSTGLLLEALRAQGVRDQTLLDVGGGIGAVQHELFREGLARATQADASPAYLEVSRREATRQGHAEQVEYVFGDFVDLAPRLPSADIVTLDRVICCYPDMERLVGASVQKAERIYGLVFPREWLVTEIAVAAENLYFRARKSAFRTFMHSSEAVDALVRSHGFRRNSYASTFMWQVVTYTRTT